MLHVNYIIFAYSLIMSCLEGTIVFMIGFWEKKDRAMLLLVLIPILLFGGVYLIAMHVPVSVGNAYVARGSNNTTYFLLLQGTGVTSFFDNSGMKTQTVYTLEGLYVERGNGNPQKVSFLANSATIGTKTVSIMQVNGFRILPYNGNLSMMKIDGETFTLSKNFVCKMSTEQVTASFIIYIITILIALILVLVRDALKDPSTYY